MALILHQVIESDRGGSKSALLAPLLKVHDKLARDGRVLAAVVAFRNRHVLGDLASFVASNLTLEDQLIRLYCRHFTKF